MTYIIIPLDGRAREVYPKPCIVDEDEYYHLISTYHGEFCYIRFDFYEGGSVYVDEDIIS